MTIKPYDAYQLACILSGQTVNGELEPMSEDFRRMAAYLAGRSKKSRVGDWNAMTVALADGEKAQELVLSQDLSKPAPAVDEPIRWATGADIRRTMTVTRWTWDGWIPASRLVGLAGLEGAGKTRTMMDLHRRVFKGLEWPDGQKMTLPKESPAVWMCADGQHDEMVELLEQYEMPLDSIVFPAPWDEPTDNTSLDEPETFEKIHAVIAAFKPWVLCVDSLTYATTFNLCEQRSIATLKKPLVDIVQKHHINVILLLHVSASGQALGKRIKGITRTLMHLECPAPDNFARLRFWVEKSYGKKPPALGVTMGDKGNKYDQAPPDRVDSVRAPAPSERLDKAVAFLTGELAKGDRQWVGLLDDWQAGGGSKGTHFQCAEEDGG